MRWDILDLAKKFLDVGGVVGLCYQEQFSVILNCNSSLFSLIYNASIILKYFYKVAFQISKNPIVKIAIVLAA